MSSNIFKLRILATENVRFDKSVDHDKFPVNLWTLTANILPGTFPSKPVFLHSSIANLDNFKSHD